jgi:hypothetical protein
MPHVFPLLMEPALPRFALAEGEILVLDNHRCWHGRDAHARERLVRILTVSRSETRFRIVSWDFAARSARRLQPSRGVVVAGLPDGAVLVRPAGGADPR